MSKGRDLVRLQEGLDLQAYADTRGKKTIGRGHLIKDPLVHILLRNRGGISLDIANELFALDYEDALAVARKALHRDADENDPRDAAFISAAFQLDMADWPKMAEAFRLGDWERAALEAETSTAGGPSGWSEQTPERCAEFCDMVRAGEWPARLAG